jgi:ABC-type multidrug transport system fused ATPase/permease subunit
MKGPIVIPAGSGKTTLSYKYKELYDIDSFHTEQDIKNLNKLFKEVSLTTIGKNIIFMK